jgi:hypothetical protein
MSGIDPRVRELFTHLRQVVDIIEDLMLRRSIAPVQQPEPRQPAPFPSAPSAPQKLAYSIKEVR